VRVTNYWPLGASLLVIGVGLIPKNLSVVLTCYCAKLDGSAVVSSIAESFTEKFAPLRDPFPGELGAHI